MKWLLIIAGSLIAIVAIAWVIGSLMPRNHTASRTMRLKQTPDSVWITITDRAGMPSWRPDVVKVERLPDQDTQEVWQEVYKNGWKLPMRTVGFEPPRRLVTRIADPSMPFGGTWTYEIQPTPAGCTLRITEDGFVSNPIFRIFSRFSDQTKTMTDYMINLAGKYGEAAVFE